ncbi:hypothetical protein VTJ83DRAFT_3322 [Remersonia thermophila]|uniref:Casein kinase substrate phosphoprotein PP28 domain-containing protein n=1 Tax=Remersonia thermophila TaxID=72144 RepID=A0ABR4DF49_9PEZI
MSGRPGASSRGRGGKFKKPTRGGGKHYSRDLRPVDADGNEISMWSIDAQHQRAMDDSSDEGSSDGSESGSDDDARGGPSSIIIPPPEQTELSREERRQQKKARKEAAIARSQRAVQVGDLPPSESEDEEDGDEDDDMPANPNHSSKARKQARGEVDGVADGMGRLRVGSDASAPSRREREALEAQAAKERYRKLHEQGKTDQAKADLERLRIIRERREAEAARKQAEKEEKEEQERIKKAAIEAREAKRREAALGKKGKKK